MLPQPEMHAYVQGFRPVFRRQDMMRNAELYLLALCSDLPHKNGETMEAAIPGAKQMDIFNFLLRSGCAPEALDQARVRPGVSERGHGGQALHVILDESSVLEQGKRSVGVTRQYRGCVGKVASGQAMVTLHAVWGDDDLPLTGELYLPEAWTRQAARCEAAKVPALVRFRTKPEIGLELLRRVLTWGLAVGMVHADAGYGELKVAEALQSQGWSYCLGLRGVTVHLTEEGMRPAPPPEPYSAWEEWGGLLAYPGTKARGALRGSSTPPWDGPQQHPAWR